MTKRKQLKKPTGETGPVLMSAGPRGADAEFQQLAFPTKKEDIEALIMRGFIRAAETFLPFRVQSYAPNKQADFDFDLLTSAGPKSAELAEVAFLKDVGGSYRAAPPSYKPYDFAQNVLNLILRKSTHYGGRPPAGLHLLLYITHWAFIPSQSTLSLLQFWALKRPHGFEGIYWYAPIMGDEGISFLIYPTPTDHWANFDPEALRSAVVQNLDPRGWVPGGPR
jgi:hypothetical protein